MILRPNPGGQPPASNVLNKEKRLKVVPFSHLHRYTIVENKNLFDPPFTLAVWLGGNQVGHASDPSLPQVIQNRQPTSISSPHIGH